jgi:hypothetical protein
MLHAKISVSLQVNKLPEPAQLLFTWMISHADDEGRLKGDAESVRALVVPMKHWSLKRMESYLNAIKNEGLIYRWQENNEWFIEFVKWTDHQYIQKDRFKASTLPRYSKESGRTLDTERIQTGNNSSPQAKVNEVKEKEIKRSEENISENKLPTNEPNKGKGLANPKTFQATTEGEVAALEAWNQLEHFNLMAFQVTYLTALHKGLPPDKFYQFVSEIKQDPTIEKQGAVFNSKVQAYFEEKEDHS